jgi:DNA-binding transcriptional regulator YiaG
MWPQVLCKVWGCIGKIRNQKKMQGMQMTPAQIKRIRASLGLTQRGLADALRLAPKGGMRTVRGWEAGETPISGPASLALEYLVKIHVEKPKPRTTEGE